MPVTAATPTTAVMEVPELVMNDFDPSITHSPPSSRAVVRIAPATSVPPPGSVSPNAAELLARAQRGQPLALLLLRAEPVDRHDAERRPRPPG